MSVSNPRPMLRYPMSGPDQCQTMKFYSSMALPIWYERLLWSTSLLEWLKFWSKFSREPLSGISDQRAHPHHPNWKWKLSRFGQLGKSWSRGHAHPPPLSYKLMRSLYVETNYVSPWIPSNCDLCHVVVTPLTLLVCLFSWIHKLILF